MAFSSDGKWLLSASTDNTVRLWDPKTGRQLTSLYDPYGERADGQVLSVAVTPDAKHVATGSLDGTIKLWDVAALLSRGRPRLPVQSPPEAGCRGASRSAGHARGGQTVSAGDHGGTPGR